MENVIAHQERVNKDEKVDIIVDILMKQQEIKRLEKILKKLDKIREEMDPSEVPKKV